MKILMIGGTGTISTGIVAQLVARGTDTITVFNRGKRRDSVPGVTTVLGDRTDHAAFEAQMAALGTFDVVIEMIGYSPADAESLVRAFSGRCGQLIFCSTVDVYAKPAPHYPITETNAPDNRHSPWDYAAHKVLCEQILTAASARGAFPLTIIRPVQTYDGLWVLDSLGSGLRHIDRLRKGRPIIVHGDGQSLWGAVHRDDCARAFVGALANPTAIGKAYHTSPDSATTWRDYQRDVARAIGAPEPTFVPIPVELLLRCTDRAFVTSANFAYNNCFDNTAARRDLGFAPTISWHDGVKAAWERFRASGRTLDSCDDDPFYDRLLQAWEQLSGTMAAELRGA
jgi:nucleoside-diphosphate-sugar epimerase